MNSIYSIIPPLCRFQLSKIKQFVFFQKYKNLICKNSQIININAGKRCFILGTAPSIQDINLEYLKNESVIFINSFYNHSEFDKLFNNVPEGKYFVVPPIHKSLDENDWVKLLQDLEAKVNPNITLFLGLDNYKKSLRYLIKERHLLKDFNIHYYYAGIQTNLGYYKFRSRHIDISKPVWTASTGSVYALIVAISLGFQDIYLLGIDHSYLFSEEPGTFRFYDSLNSKNEDKEIRENIKLQDKSQNTIILKGTWEAFEQYRLLLKNSGRNIVNLSPTGIVDVFERKSISDIFQTKN
jgi:hypothetical protein